MTTLSITKPAAEPQAAVAVIEQAGPSTRAGAPGASRAAGAAPPGSDRWLVLACTEDGTSRSASGPVESHATAVLAATAARTAAGLQA